MPALVSQALSNNLLFLRGKKKINHTTTKIKTFVKGWHRSLDLVYPWVPSSSFSLCLAWDGQSVGHLGYTAASSYLNINQGVAGKVLFGCCCIWLFATHGLQHARLSCPSPSPGVYPNSCPLSRWCHPTISSSVVPFSSCLQSFPVSGLFQWVSSLHQVARVLSLSFSISHSSEYSGLISFRMDWLELLAVQGTLKSLLQRAAAATLSSRHCHWGDGGAGTGLAVQESQPWPLPS